MLRMEIEGERTNVGFWDGSLRVSTLIAQRCTLPDQFA